MVDTHASAFLVGSVVGGLPQVACATSDVCHKWCVSCLTRLRCVMSGVPIACRVACANRAVNLQVPRHTNLCLCLSRSVYVPVSVALSQSEPECEWERVNSWVMGVDTCMMPLPTSL